MIVDGGLGMELAERGFVYTTKLWSGEAVLAAPELLVDVHRAYLGAGADVLATATYQLSHETLRALGYDDGAIDATFVRAVALAREAVAGYRSETGSLRPVSVAASLGPYGATVGDGSEYSGTQHLGPQALLAFHLERLSSVAKAAPDLILFETIPTQLEALAIAEAARGLALAPLWMTFTCADGERTFGGDTVRAIAACLEAFTNVEVIGVNCTAPALIASLVRELRTATAKPILVCPNLGQHWVNETHGLAGGANEAEFLRRVPDWLAAGATHVGGCCGVGPPTIASLAAVTARVAR